MCYGLTVLRSHLDAVARRLSERGDRVLHGRAGVRHASGGLELIFPGGPAAGGVPVRLFLAPPGLERISHLFWQSFPAPADPSPVLELALHPRRGLSAAMLADGRVHPLDMVRLAGPRCERWRPGVEPPELDGDVPAAGRFSRYMGALGGGRVHARIAALSVAVLGRSPAAAHLAVGLARMGVHRIVRVGAGEPSGSRAWAASRRGSRSKPARPAPPPAVR